MQQTGRGYDITSVAGQGNVAMGLSAGPSTDQGRKLHLCCAVRCCAADPWNHSAWSSAVDDAARCARDVAAEISAWPQWLQTLLTSQGVSQGVSQEGSQEDSGVVAGSESDSDEALAAGLPALRGRVARGVSEAAAARRGAEQLRQEAAQLRAQVNPHTQHVLG